MKSLKIIMMFLAISFSAMSCSAQKNSDTVREQLSKAKENGNTVFMVVTDSKTSAEQLTQLVQRQQKSCRKLKSSK